MEIKTEYRTSSKRLDKLAHFAGYLLAHHIDDYTALLLSLSRNVRIPILGSLAHLTEEELYSFAITNNTEFLQALQHHRHEAFTATLVERFKANGVPNIDSNNILAADITTGAYLRKQAFAHFVPDYCSSVQEALELIGEIDAMILVYETAMAEAYAGLLQKRIEERNLLIERVNRTLPGAVYIFDLQAYQNIYATDKLAQVIGYSDDELNALGPQAITRLIHEADKPALAEHIQKLSGAADNFICSYKYRIRLKDGSYRWIRNYETVFKRDEAGSVLQTIAIAIDINKEKSMAEDLKKRESELREAHKLFKQAQALSHLGHYSMEFKTGLISFTEEASRIYGFEPGIEKFNYEDIIPLRHPEDYEKAQSIIQHTLETHDPFDFHFRIINKKGTEKTIHTLGNVLYDEHKNATHLVGTIQDVTERHGLLKKLQESENLYKQAQALVHLGNWIMDFQTGQYVLSEEMYQIYQLPPGSTFSVADWEAYTHPDDRREVFDYLQECISKKKPYDKYHRVVLQDGTIKTLHRKGEFIYNDNGVPVKLVGTTQDVTEQHRVQQELKDNQVFIRKITDAAPSIITLNNVKSGAYVFVSEGLQKLLGYATAALMEAGVDFWNGIIHPDDMDLVRQQNVAALRKAHDGKRDEVMEATYRIKHQNGDYRWFHTYGTIFDRDRDGGVEHILNITLDVSAQVAAEEKIAEQELFIQHIADASPTILYIFDVGRNGFHYVNKEIFFVLGYAAGEVEAMGGDVVAKLYHPEDLGLLPERRESSKHFQHTTSMIQYECRMKSKDDEWKWLLVREVVFKADDAGQPLQILGAALDISKRKEMERSLLQNSFQLEQSNASLEEFAYVASHDLKEPLRKISTFGDRLVTTQAERLSDDGKTYLNKIVDASQRMQHMINDLLSISLISGDRSFQPFSLQAVLEDAQQTLEYKIEKRGAIITADPLPQVNIVPSQFRQLFQNLLSNSLKFTPPERTPKVNITAQFLSPDDVQEFQIVQAPQYLKLQFQDNGIGFESEYAGKIFQIFQRLHGKSEYEGTGIGLAICKKIVEHHGGIIYAAGALDEGSTFTIILPA